MIMMTWFAPCSWPLEGGHFWEFLVWVGCPIVQILTFFKLKNVIFHTGFQIRSLEFHTHFYTWSNLASSRLSDSGASVSFRFIFVFVLSQFSGPNYLEAWNRLGLIRQNYVIIIRLEHKQKHEFFKEKKRNWEKQLIPRWSMGWVQIVS